MIPKNGGKLENIKIISYPELRKLKEYCILITCVYAHAREINAFLTDQGETNPIYFFSNPFKVEEKLLTYDQILNNKLFDETYSLLSDDKSKNIFIGFTNWKITGDLTYSYKFTEGNWKEFFATSLIPDNLNYTYVDVGAYTGDSIIRFLAFSKGQYEKIIAFEPDKNNYAAMKDCLEKLRITDNIEYHNEGLWSRKTQLSFFQQQIIKYMRVLISLLIQIISFHQTERIQAVFTLIVSW